MGFSQGGFSEFWLSWNLRERVVLKLRAEPEFEKISISFECKTCQTTTAYSEEEFLSPEMLDLNQKMKRRGHYWLQHYWDDFCKDLDQGFDKMFKTTLYQRPSHRAPQFSGDEFGCFDVKERCPCKNIKRFVEKRAGKYKRAPKQAAVQSLPHADEITPQTSGKTDNNIDETGAVSKVHTIGMYGQDTLDFWKRTAGKNKSWRRSPAVATQPHNLRCLKRGYRQSFEIGISNLAVSLPATFLRAQYRNMRLLSSSIACHQVLGRKPKQDAHPILECHYRDNEEHLCWDDRDIVAHDQSSVDHDDIDQHDQLGPGDAFIQLTWNLANVDGHTGRFLPRGLRFRNGWCFGAFVRDESFADVYSVSQETIDSCLARRFDLEAYHFLHGLYGKSEHYAVEHKKRMHKSGNCMDTFWYNDRHIFIMNIPQAPNLLRCRNTEQEYPALVNQKAWAKKMVQTQRALRRRPTYAAVLSKPVIEPPITELPHSSDTTYAKEMSRIDLVIAKKRQKQRSKRQVQRESKRLHLENHG
jgi:hypothetical protein